MPRLHEIHRRLRRSARIAVTSSASATRPASTTARPISRAGRMPSQRRNTSETAGETSTAAWLGRTTRSASTRTKPARHGASQSAIPSCAPSASASRAIAQYSKKTSADSSSRSAGSNRVGEALSSRTQPTGPKKPIESFLTQ